MDLLILMRHAKAVAEHDAPDDRSRALAAKGRADAPQAGAALAALDLRPDRALVSAAARTRETWSLVAPVLGDPPAEMRETLYMAEAETIWNEAVRSGASRVMIVGHNPGVHELAHALLVNAADRSRLARQIAESMAPASWAAFRVTGERLGNPGAALVAGWAPPF